MNSRRYIEIHICKWVIMVVFFDMNGTHPKC